MRARAFRVARRVASTALERLAREVDRLALALEPVREAIALQGTSGGGGELEVTRRADRRAPTAMEPAPPSREPPTRPTPSVQPSLGIAQATDLRSRVEPHLAAIRQGGTWEQAEDPVEAIHRLRVATRRLRAFTSLFAPLMGHERAHKLARRLRAITRALGPRREWDVLLEALRAEHAKAEPLTKAALEHVIAWAEGQRDGTTRKTRKALARTDLGALADALDSELDRVCGRVLRLDEELATQAKAWLEPELSRAFEGMPRPDREDEVEALHEVRKRAKRARYAVELLRPSLGTAYADLRRPLKQVQSTLGRHRDATQRAERLHEQCAALADRGLRTLAGALERVARATTERRQRAFEQVLEVLARLDTRRVDRPEEP